MQATNRKCTTCRKKVPAEEALVSSLRAFCSYECLRSFTNSKKGQEVVQKAKKQDLRERKESIKTLPTRIKEAQVAFNRYVRIRDENKPCISCGSEPVQQRVGGMRDCGHYLSRGAHGNRVRYRLDNTASQCVHCNRYLSGNVANFRLGLIDRWGIDRITALENDRKVVKFSEAYLIRIKDIFNRRANLYTKLRSKCLHVNR